MITSDAVLRGPMHDVPLTDKPVTPPPATQLDIVHITLISLLDEY